jgi:hypothetical protein
MHCMDNIHSLRAHRKQAPPLLEQRRGPNPSHRRYQWPRLLTLYLRPDRGATLHPPCSGNGERQASGSGTRGRRNATCRRGAFTRSRCPTVRVSSRRSSHGYAQIDAVAEEKSPHRGQRSRTAPVRAAYDRGRVRASERGAGDQADRDRPGSLRPPKRAYHFILGALRV